MVILVEEVDTAAEFQEVSLEERYSTSQEVSW